MELLRLVSLLVYTFGVFASGSLLVYWIFPSAARRQAAPAEQTREQREAHLVSLLITFASFLWFVNTLLLTLLSFDPEIRPWPLWTVQAVLVFSFPPLIMHVNHAGRCHEQPPLRRPAWRWPLRLAYAASAILCGGSLLGFYQVIDVPRRTVSITANVSLGILFSVAAIYSSLAVSRGRKKSESTGERSMRRTTVGLLLLLMLMGGLIALESVTRVGYGSVLQLVGSSLPLAFLFAAVYHESRFDFFDLFVKGGLYLSLTIALFAACFGLVWPLLGRLGLGWTAPWVQAIVLLPLVVALPALHRLLARRVEAYWLGRRHTPVEAVKRFLSGLREATSERRLAESAQEGLSAIFQAPTRVRLDPGDTGPVGFEPLERIPIRSAGSEVGEILMGRRQNQMPYFSEDIVLLDSLADVLSHMRENVMLQKRKQEHEQRAQELSLQASRSELKALRAQINPHFLFNALNAIAGLIHKDPLRADRTVVQLSEVFRYTLRRSENEWCRLDEELEFVRAYLEVEQARFGQRLEFEIHASPAVGALRVPGMMVQTLVENAVKHGIATLRGSGRLEIRAGLSEGLLEIDVADSGPGFADTPGDRSRLERGASSGYGLANVRRRLAGYFGGRAELRIGRDAERAMTVVSLRLPPTEDVRIAKRAVDESGKETRDDPRAARR